MVMLPGARNSALQAGQNSNLAPSNVPAPAGGGPTGSSGGQNTVPRLPGVTGASQQNQIQSTSQVADQLSAMGPNNALEMLASAPPEIQELIVQLFLNAAQGSESSEPRAGGGNPVADMLTSVGTSSNTDSPVPGTPPPPTDGTENDPPVIQQAISQATGVPTSNSPNDPTSGSSPKLLQPPSPSDETRSPSPLITQNDLGLPGDTGAQTPAEDAQMRGPLTAEEVQRYMSQSAPQGLSELQQAAARPAPAAPPAPDTSQNPAINAQGEEFLRMLMEIVQNSAGQSQPGMLQVQG